MTKDDIKRFQFRQPFEPFDLVLSDGRSFRVSHPEFLLHSPRSQSITVADERDGKFRLLDLRHVIRVESDVEPGEEPPRDKLGLADGDQFS